MFLVVFCFLVIKQLAVVRQDHYNHALWIRLTTFQNPYQNAKQRHEKGVIKWCFWCFFYGGVVRQAHYDLLVELGSANHHLHKKHFPCFAFRLCSTWPLNINKRGKARACSVLLAIKLDFKNPLLPNILLGGSEFFCLQTKMYWNLAKITVNKPQKVYTKNIWYF